MFILFHVTNIFVNSFILQFYYFLFFIIAKHSSFVIENSVI